MFVVQAILQRNQRNRFIYDTNTKNISCIFTLTHDFKVHFNHYQEQLIMSRSLVDITVPNTLYFQSKAYIIINIIYTLQTILFVVYVFKTA